MLRFNLLFSLSLLGNHIAAGIDGPDCNFPINWDNPACMNNKRIVGGENAPADKYPWFSRHIFRDSRWAGCGGMLVAPEYVLTAAHCVSPNTSWSANVAAVQIGAVCSPYASNNNCNQPVQQINVESIKPHPDYNSGTLNNDYALVKLASRATATPVKMDDGQYVDNYPSGKRNLYAIGKV
jgi:secreted trypsin-like serine protease